MVKKPPATVLKECCLDLQSKRTKERVFGKGQYHVQRRILDIARRKTAKHCWYLRVCNVLPATVVGVVHGSLGVHYFAVCSGLAGQFPIPLHFLEAFWNSVVVYEIKIVPSTFPAPSCRFWSCKGGSTQHQEHHKKRQERPWQHDLRFRRVHPSWHCPIIISLDVPQIRTTHGSFHLVQGLIYLGSGSQNRRGLVLRLEPVSKRRTAKDQNEFRFQRCRGRLLIDFSHDWSTTGHKHVVHIPVFHSSSSCWFNQRCYPFPLVQLRHQCYTVSLEIWARYALINVIESDTNT